ncbi:TetR/AcrR family transcriptional regulator [Dietzia psychralcaliphila]|uniref:TetR family transcriptional regulator n=1 Tax=Dietzia psychralcaliphila TaxID=139021 RepID=A0AAD0JQL6_9ACTN|nr:TetR/AcrR family transcriptional regulator [Dietzia psychralcaliphila]AWH95014.1 TetR family transcriptional regulator [Dietzia psychralcaliphila]PTM87214.1 TetR family transcriptional regulator [Dietzia psychralcaliphila]
MAQADPGVLSRAQRRKAQTRRSLIGAAQQLMAQGRTAVSVLDITTMADVGNGSFYNHFATKEELFEAAVMSVVEDHGELLDAFTEGMSDPAHMFTQSFRLTGRLHRRYPELSRVVVNHGLSVLATADAGLLPRARRDIEAAVAARRFVATDIDVALTVVSGSALTLALLLHDQPGRDDAATTDAVTAHVLRALGVSEDEAAALIALPLPDWG